MWVLGTLVHTYERAKGRTKYVCRAAGRSKSSCSDKAMDSTQDEFEYLQPQSSLPLTFFILFYFIRYTRQGQGSEPEELV